MYKYFVISGWLIIFMAFSGCKREHEYEQRVKEELATGVRYDSLFLGLHLGMVQRDFYAHCWEMNKKGMIRQGTNNTTVLYKMKELEEPAEMNFYPNFYENKIWEMPVRVNYDAWAPWNKHLSADSLEQDLLGLFRRWYGDDFIEIKHRKKGIAYVQVRGNRRITIYKADDRYVMVNYTDMLVEKELRETGQLDSDKTDKEMKLEP